MKTDKELLELAAKAAGIPVLAPSKDGEDFLKSYDSAWNPLTDDGDALRLAVELSIDLKFYSKVAEASAWFDGELIDVLKEGHSNNKQKATRRAIVRAAAAIGERL